MQRNRGRSARMMVLGAAFLLCCVLYIIRMAALQLTPEHIGGNQSDGYSTRTVVVQAVRGQIYDRNGVPLVTNEYTYSLTLDYSVFPKDADSRNKILLTVLHALQNRGQGDKINAYRYPLTGQYPDLSYTEQARTDTLVYNSLVSEIKRCGLRTEILRELRDQGMSKAESAEAFDADPLSYATAERLVAYLVEEHSLEKTADGIHYSHEQINRLLPIYYGMGVMGFSRANDYVIAHDMTRDAITYVKELSLDGVDFSMSFKRVYAYPGYASHILGQTGPIYEEDWEYYKELGYNMNVLVGISGCEAAFESYLHGQDGVKVIVEDRDGNIIDEYMKTEPVAGKDVYLTLDINLQIAAEDSLAENVQYVNDNVYVADSKAGAVVAVDPSNGEVLALASYPTYDLTTYNMTYGDLLADEGIPLLNRALNGVYAPGSTYKPGVATAALCEGVVESHTKLECAGVYTYYKSYQPRCWIYHSSSSSIREHGWINVEEALEVSCNCYFYETGRLLGIDRLNQYMKQFGLGQSTGIELNESTGILAGPAYREENHLLAWQNTDTIVAAIGQSDNAFTPLQLSVYISTLVNGGTRYGAHLLLKTVDFATGEATNTSESVALSHVNMTESVRQTILSGMKRVAESNATVRNFMKNVPSHVTVAAKTGTAQVGGDQPDNGLFVCCASEGDMTGGETPDIVIAAVIERCGGGSYPSMTAGRILEAYYNSVKIP